MKRQHATKQQQDSFRESFGRVVLRKAGMQLQDVGDEALCAIFEGLGCAAKRGVWRDVAAEVGRSKAQVAQYYHNIFKRAMYPEPLTDRDKEAIRAYILDNGGVTAGEAISHFVGRLSGVFPSTIQNYIHHNFARVRQGEGGRRGAAPGEEQDPVQTLYRLLGVERPGSGQCRGQEGPAATHLASACV